MKSMINYNVCFAIKLTFFGMLCYVASVQAQDVKPVANSTETSFNSYANNGEIQIQLTEVKKKLKEQQDINIELKKLIRKREQELIKLQEKLKHYEVQASVSNTQE